MPRVVQVDIYNITTKSLALENGDISAASNGVPFLRFIYDDFDIKGVGAFSYFSYYSYFSCCKSCHVLQ